MVQDDVLELCRQVYFQRAHLRELVEVFRRQRGRAVLYRAAHAVAAGSRRHLPQGVEVDRHFGDGAVRQDHATVRRSSVHADLRQPALVADPGAERRIEALDERFQLIDGAVLLADFTDLATNGDRHATRLELTNERCQLGAAPVILALLLGQRRERQLDQRGRVDVDVAIARRDRLADELLQAVDHALRIGGVLLRVGLIVIALNEDRTCMALLDRGRHHHRRELFTALVRIAHLAARELEDEGAHVAALCRGNDRAGKVIRHRPHIHGRHRQIGVLLASSRLVQRIDAGALYADFPTGFPDHPAGHLAHVAFTEDGRMHKTIDGLAAERRRVLDPQSTVEVEDRASALNQLLNGCERHRSSPSTLICRGSITLALSPTDPRSTHPKLSRALERLGTADLVVACAEPAPAELGKAIHEFNAGEFFEQHETLELLWRATPGEIRHLYEGILQIGVGMHHLLRNRNFHGAAVKLDHGIRLLEAFPAICHGVDVERLRRDATAARARLLELGPSGLGHFEAELIPRVHLVGET